MSALPKKIYLNYVDENAEVKTWSEEPVSFYGKMKNREYTDLSQVWHDASEEPQGDYTIYCEDQAIYFWVTNRRVVEMSATNWKDYVRILGVGKWAYCTELAPKGGVR